MAHLDEEPVEHDEQAFGQTEGWNPPAEKPAPPGISLQLGGSGLDLLHKALHAALIDDEVVGVRFLGLQRRLSRNARLSLLPAELVATGQSLDLGLARAVDDDDFATEAPEAGFDQQRGVHNAHLDASQPVPDHLPHHGSSDGGVGDFVEDGSLGGVVEDDGPERFSVQGAVVQDDGRSEVLFDGLESWLAGFDDLAGEHIEVHQSQLRLVFEIVGRCGFPAGNASGETYDC